MELFTINRYDEKSIKNDPEKENKLLDKLLKKAEKKKRKLTETQPSLEEVSATQKSILPKQEENKQKKLKIDPEVEEIADGGDTGDFQVLGEDVFEKKKKVEMVLPPWLAYPTIIANKIEDSEATEDEDSSLCLTENIKQSLKEMGITSMFPVQKAVIPWVLRAHSKPTPFRPRDICVSAPTGSGKTLAFAIPLVQLLSKQAERKIRALVVLPTAELSVQVFKVFKQLCKDTDLKVMQTSKSTIFSAEQEKLVEEFKGQYYSKVDILVTTPGRLVEHIHATKGFCLKSLKFLVIDEADRIMDQVHHNWLYHLDTHVKTTSDMLLSGRSAPLCVNELESSTFKQPHKMLFSATLSQDPEKLQNLKLFQPKLFTSVSLDLEGLAAKLASKTADGVDSERRGEFVGKYTTPAELTEKYCVTDVRTKPLSLYSLIEQNGWKKFLCFTNSAEATHRLAFVLQFLFNKSKIVSELSASLPPKMRTNILSDFAKGKINGLVCSDALARGIDFPDVDIVISYDRPRHITTYIHRIGRTARAGRQGTAITLLAENEINYFKNTLREVGKNLTEQMTVDSTFEEQHSKQYSTALDVLRNKLEKENKKRTVQKTLAKEKALPIDPSTMSIMEKLQAETQNSMITKATKSLQEAKPRKRNSRAQRKNKNKNTSEKVDN